MRNDTWYKYQFYRGCTILFILLVIIGSLYYSGINITDTSNIKKTKTEYSNGNHRLDSQQVVDNIYINPNYYYSFLRMSNGNIRYNRYYPDNCYVNLNSDWIITSKTSTCTDDDLKIILHQKNIEESK